MLNLFSCKKLIKYFKKAYDVDRAIRMERSRYTKMKYDKPRELREKLMNYLSMHFKETVDIDSVSYEIKNFSLKNNVFLNYCYDELNFGKKRLFKKMVDVDMYLYDECVEEEDPRACLEEKLNNKYNGLLSRDEINRKVDIILEQNGEYEVCVQSGAYRYDIENHIKRLVVTRELKGAADKLKRIIRMRNVLKRSEISSTVFYKPKTYIDQARDILNSLEIFSIHLPIEICPVVHNLKEHVLKKLETPEIFHTKIGVKPAGIARYEKWLYSFAAGFINKRVSDSRSKMNEYLKKYSSVSGNWTRDIGNMKNTFDYLKDGIDTRLRILGFSDSEIEREHDTEVERLEGRYNRITFHEVKGTLINFISILNLLHRVCDNGVSILNKYGTGLDDAAIKAIKKAFSVSGFRSKLKGRLNFNLPIGVISNFSVSEIYTEGGAISLLDFEAAVILLKLIIIEIVNHLFIDGILPAKGPDAEYNRSIADILEYTIIKRVRDTNSLNDISVEEIQTVNNALTGARNKRRLKNYGVVAADKAGGLHKAFRTLGLGREFNAGRGFAEDISITELYNADIKNFDTEYNDADVEGDQMGVIGDIAGEDDHDEIEGYYGE